MAPPPLRYGPDCIYAMESRNKACSRESIPLLKSSDLSSLVRRRSEWTANMYRPTWEIVPPKYESKMFENGQNSEHNRLDRVANGPG